MVGPLPSLLSRFRLLPNPDALLPELPVRVSYSRHGFPPRGGVPVEERTGPDAGHEKEEEEEEEEEEME